jgi:hypothetical protein
MESCWGLIQAFILYVDAREFGLLLCIRLDGIYDENQHFIVTKEHSLRDNKVIFIAYMEQNPW